MATPNTPPNNQQNIDELHSIQNNLFTITDQYKEWNKQAHVNNNETRQTISNTTSLNKLINKALDISSKIGKEIINQKTTNRAILSLQSEAQKLIRSYESTYSKLNKSQQKQVDLLEQQQQQFKKLKDEAEQYEADIIDQNNSRLSMLEKLNDLGDKGLQNTQEYATLENEITASQRAGIQLANERYQVEQKYQTLENNIQKAYKSQSVSTALVQREQAEGAKSTLGILEKLPQQIEQSNKALRTGKFWTEAIGKVPILSKFKELPKLMESFGGKGLIALGAIGLVAATLEKIIKLMFAGDQQITDIQKQFSLSREQAESIRQSFYEISANAGKFADIQAGTLISEKDIYEAQLEFNKAFGTAIVMSGAQLVQLAKVKDLIGLSEEGMKGLMTYSLGSGKAIQNIDRAVLGTSRIIQAQTGIQLNNKEVLEEVYKTTGGIRANFKGNVQELAKAVTQAKLYGTTLEQIQHTSDSLLDFESSIENQLEAELLTGRQINLERARAAALAGDTSTVMEEMVKQAGNFDQFMHYNVIAQNSLAKAFGMTRDEMSDMLFQQKAIEGLRKAGNNEEKKSLSERYQQLVKEGKSREELEQTLGAETEQRLATQSAQEKFQKIIERIEDIIGRLFDGGLLEKAATMIGGLLEHLSSGGSLFGALTNSEAYQQAQARVGAQISGVHDSVISPKGAIMISTPRGQISTDPGDSIITTTNPGSLLNGGSSANMKGVESKLDQVIALLGKGGNVYIDGKKAGTALALGYNASL